MSRVAPYASLGRQVGTVLVPREKAATTTERVTSSVATLNPLQSTTTNMPNPLYGGQRV